MVSSVFATFPKPSLVSSLFVTSSEGLPERSFCLCVWSLLECWQLRVDASDIVMSCSSQEAICSFTFRRPGWESRCSTSTHLPAKLNSSTSRAIEVSLIVLRRLLHCQDLLGQGSHGLLDLLICWDHLPRSLAREREILRSTQVAELLSAMPECSPERSILSLLYDFGIYCVILCDSMWVVSCCISVKVLRLPFILSIRERCPDMTTR